MEKPKTFRDPIHDYILVAEEPLKLIETMLEGSSGDYLQRLRYIKQNGPAYLVYPSLTGSRFEHSLGVMHISERIFDSLTDENKYVGQNPNPLQRFYERIEEDFKKFKIDLTKDNLDEIIIYLGLLHDCGHLPFSHTTEPAFKDFLYSTCPSYPSSKFHELITLEIINQSDLIANSNIKKAVILSELSDSYLGEIIGLEDTVYSTLKKLVSSEIDADRGDYLLRDGYYIGSGFGAYDHHRLINAFKFVVDRGNVKVAIDTRAISAIEAALFERYKLYKWVYWHHKVVFFNEIASRLMSIIINIDPSLNEGFFEKHHDITTTSEYTDELCKKLKTSYGFPPLVLFDGEKIGLDTGWYKIKIDYLINVDNGYFDDFWFMNKLRNLSPATQKEKIYKGLLTRRAPLSLSLWKDFAGFNRINTQFAGQFILDERIAGSISPAFIEQIKIKDFFPELRRRAKEAIPFTRLESSLLESIEKEFEESLGVDGIFAIVAKTNHLLYGKVENIEILDRDQRLTGVSYLSPVLERLEELEVEIPFFVYIIGIDKGKIQNLDKQCLKEKFISSMLNVILMILGREDEDKKNLRQLIEGLKNG